MTLLISPGCSLLNLGRHSTTTEPAVIADKLTGEMATTEHLPSQLCWAPDEQTRLTLIVRVEGSSLSSSCLSPLAVGCRVTHCGKMPMKEQWSFCKQLMRAAVVAAGFAHPASVLLL